MNLPRLVARLELGHSKSSGRTPAVPVPPCHHQQELGRPTLQIGGDNTEGGTAELHRGAGMVRRNYGHERGCGAEDEER